VAGYSNTTGTSNTALGALALYTNSTASRNTAVGQQAMYYTTGADNSALGDNALRNNSTGASNVAIGSGALFTSTTASDNTTVGYQAGYSLTTGTQNTAIGSLALRNTTANYYNVAVGYNALRLNSNDGNTAVGNFAAYQNISGGNLVAMGYNAMSSNVSGANNVAIGVQSLGGNTSASGNTAVGHQALLYNNGTLPAGSFVVGVSYVIAFVGTTDFVAIGAASNTVGVTFTATGIGSGTGTATANGGASNTAVGYLAARLNTTGFNLDAFGRDSLGLNTTGTNNTALANSALYGNTTGSYNVGVGIQALQANTTANNNTAVGYQAGYSNTTGAGNTIVGMQAGYFLTTGSNNTFIGRGGDGAGQAVTTGSKNTIIGGYNGNAGGLDIRTSNNYIVLSDGDGTPWWVLNGNTGTQSLRQSGYSNITPVMKVSGFGYSPSSYRAIVVGGQTTTGTYNSICLGYDPVANTSGAFGGTGNEIYVQNGVTIAQPNSTNTTFQSVMVFESNGSGVRFSQNIGIGGSSPTTSGSGVTFPATQSASSDANTLDDYEEGTWTPTWVGDVTNPTVTYSEQFGSYTKVGRLVTYALRLVITARSGGSGNLNINGIPFSPTTAAVSGTVSFSYGYASPILQQAASGAELITYTEYAGVSNTRAPVSALPTSGTFYFVAAGFFYT
jgi:hypothetical protein